MVYSLGRYIDGAGVQNKSKYIYVPTYNRFC